MEDAREAWGVWALIAASVIAFVIGAFVGVVTTFVHRQWQTPWGSLDLPLGLILGVVLCGCVVAGLRLAFESRVVALLGAVGMVAACAVLATPGPGGSIVVADDWLGWTWAIVPSVVSAIAIVLPSRRPAAAEEPVPGD